MPASNKNVPNKQVFDIAKPGKSAAAATSRPVIVNHGPMMRDPMVSDKEEKSTEEKTAPTAPTHRVITPPSATKADPVSAEPAPESKPSEPEATPEESAPAPEKPEEKTETSAPNQAAVNALAEQANRRKKSDPTAEELARTTEIEKLIETKKYAVPIGEVRRRRNTRRLFVSLIALAVIAVSGLYLAVDAGLLDAPIDLPYEFLKG